MASSSAENPRKRPHQARAKVTVAAILEAAAHVLVARGVAGFNTNAVAERAGVSVGSLYQYFPNKAAVVTEMVRAKRARLLAGLRAAKQAHEGSDLDVVLAGLIQATVCHQRDWPQLGQVLDQAALWVPPQAENEALNDAIQQILVDVLVAHAVPDAQTAAFDLMNLCRGMVDGALLRDETDDAALVARVMRAASGYLR